MSSKYFLEEVIPALEAGTFVYDDARQHELEPFQRQAVLTALAVQAAQAGTVATGGADADNDVPAIQAVEVAVATLNSDLSALLADVESNTEINGDILVELQTILTELQTQTGELADIDLNTANSASELILVRSDLADLLAELNLFRANYLSINSAISGRLNVIVGQLDDIYNTIIALYDYSSDIVRADTDGRLIVRATWADIDAQTVAVGYFELDGITPTSASDNAVADDNPPVETVVKDIKFVDDGFQIDAYVIRRRTYAVEADGSLTQISEIWLDDKEVPLLVTPDINDLVPQDRAQADVAVRNTTRWRRIESVTGSEFLNTLPLMFGFSNNNYRFGLKSVTVTCVKLDDPANAPNIATPDGVGGFDETAFDVVGESVTFDVGDTNDYIIDGLLRVPETAVPGANAVKVTALGRTLQLTL